MSLSLFLIIFTNFLISFWSLFAITAWMRKELHFLRASLKNDQRELLSQIDSVNDKLREMNSRLLEIERNRK